MQPTNSHPIQEGITELGRKTKGPETTIHIVQKQQDKIHYIKVTLPNSQLQRFDPAQYKEAIQFLANDAIFKFKKEGDKSKQVKVIKEKDIKNLKTKFVNNQEKSKGIFKSIFGDFSKPTDDFIPSHGPLPPKTRRKEFLPLPRNLLSEPETFSNSQMEAAKNTKLESLMMEYNHLAQDYANWKSNIGSGEEKSVKGEINDLASTIDMYIYESKVPNHNGDAITLSQLKAKIDSSRNAFEVLQASKENVPPSHSDLDKIGNYRRDFSEITGFQLPAQSSKLSPEGKNKLKAEMKLSWMSMLRHLKADQSNTNNEVLEKVQKLNTAYTELVKYYG